MRRTRLLVVAMMIFMARPAAAQTDVITTARAMYSSGQHPQALATLQSHLSGTPRDVDARLVYGLMLSWDGRYEDARMELQRVLTQTPEYKDARVALMNVAWWSGRTAKSRRRCWAISTCLVSRRTNSGSSSKRA